MAFSWSKAEPNRFGMPVRTSKCGRARIVKLSAESATYNEYLPLLDGDALPRYYKLSTAKEAVEAAEAGLPLPKSKRPKYAVEYDYDPAKDASKQPDAEARYKRAQDWFKKQTGKKAGDVSPYAVLGLGEDASWTDVKKTFRQLTLKLHPDHGGDEEQYKGLKDAYEQIKKLEEDTIHV